MYRVVLLTGAVLDTVNNMKYVWHGCKSRDPSVLSAGAENTDAIKLSEREQTA